MLWIFIILLLAISIIGITLLLHKKSHSNTPSPKNPITSILQSKFHSLPKSNRIHYPVLYINLDRSPKRNEFMLQQFKNHNIQNYKRIQGVDGSKIEYSAGTVMEDPPVRIILNEDFGYMNQTSPEMTKSELGCSLSHIKAIKYAYDNRLGTVLVLEDDADLSLMPLWKYSLPELVRNAPDGWDYIKLHHLYGPLDKKHDFVKEVILPWSAAAYLISPKGQSKVMEKFDMDEILTIKTFPAEMLIFTNMDTYTLSTPYVFQNNAENNSTIHTEHTYGHIIIAIEILKLYT